MLSHKKCTFGLGSKRKKTRKSDDNVLSHEFALDVAIRANQAASDSANETKTKKIK